MNVSLSDFETRVKAEYGWFRSLVALHPMLSVLATAVIAGVTGHYVHPHVY